MKKYLKTALIFIYLCLLPLLVNAAAGSREEFLRLMAEGQKQHLAGNFREALLYCQKAHGVCEEKKDCATALSSMGMLYGALGDAKKSIDLSGQALVLLKEILAKTGTEFNNTDNLFTAIDRIEAYQAIIITLNNIGGTYRTYGSLKKALECFQLALKMSEDLQIYYGMYLSNNNLGEFYLSWGEYGLSLEHLKKALRISERLNKPELLAAALNNLGGFYEKFNKYKDALGYFERSLKISRENKMAYFAAVNYDNLSSVYLSLGDYDLALDYLNKSLDIKKTLALKGSDEAITINNIAAIYALMGDYTTALKFYKEAFKKLKVSGVPLETARIINNLGMCYLRLKDYKMAEESFLKANQERMTTGYVWATNPAFIELYIVTKRYEEAYALLSKATPEWSSPPAYFIQHYTLMGLTLKGMGELKESSHNFLNAVKIIEEMRYTRKVDKGFLTVQDRLGAYKGLADVLCRRYLKQEKGDLAFSPYGEDLLSAAFYFSESTKARTLLEAMAESAKKYESQELPPELHKKEQDIINQLSAIEDNWERTYKQGKEAFKALTERKKDLRQQLDSFISQIRKDYPKYAALNYPQPILAEQIPLNNNEVLLEYALCDDATYLFKVKKGGVKEIIKIPKGKEGVENIVREFCVPFEPNLQTQTIPYQNFSVQKAETLYKLLLADALKDTPPQTNIIIVPDGILGRLPFEALVINPKENLQKTIFVTDKWNISYYQSATVLALNRMLGRSKASKPIFALGNPIYNKYDPRYLAYREGKPQPVLMTKDANKDGFRALATDINWGRTTQDDKKTAEIVFNPLPETEEEIKSIAQIFNTQARPPDILLGIFANETNLRNTKLKQYRLLHFATHADLPGKIQGINEPFLLLGQVENSPQEDGFLTLTEVLNIPLDADMVVLSACVTARGKAMEGEGLLNFARAFQYAGARTVLVSLWEVASGLAVEYMELFYRYLKEGKPKSEALSLARKEIKQKYPNPFFWAVFILHGEG